MKYYVEINGESSLNIQGLAIQSLPPISKPLMRSKQETIDGRDGDVITKLGYAAYDKTLKIGLWGNYDINEIITFFNQEGEIVFSSEPDKYYRFTILNRDDYVNQLEIFKTATIILHCQPYKYLLNEEPKEMENEYITETNVSSATFTNTLEAPMNIDLKGNTNQDSYTGKNLFNINQTHNDQNVHSSVSNNVLTQTNEKAYARTEWEISGLTIGQTYTLKMNYSNPNASSIQFRFYDSTNTSLVVSGTIATSISGTLETTFTATETTQWLRLYSNTSNTSNTYSVVFNNIQLEQSSTSTSYEPYVGGTPSPNPDYPQEVKVVSGNNSISVVGKNLFDKSNVNDIACSMTSSGITNTSQAKTIYIPCLPNKTYTISKMQSARFRVGTTSEIPSANVNVSDYISNDNSTNITLTTSSDAKYLIAFVYISTVDTLTYQQILDSIQVEQGNQATTYEAYNGTTYNINLPSGMELNKIGTYQDYIYKEDDKWYLHKEIGKVVLNGSETGWNIINDNQFYRNAPSDFYVADAITYFNNYYQTIPQVLNMTIFNQQTANIDYAFAFKNRSDSKGVAFKNKDITDLDTFKTWLSTHNVIIDYVLETPTNTEITYQPLIEQLESIKNAMSKEGTTNVNQVNNDAPFMLDLSVFSGSDTLTINNIGNAPSKPVITLVGSGNVGLYLNDIQVFQISLGTNETIILDTENMEAYYGSQLKNRQVIGDYNSFALQSGENTIRFTGSVSYIEITNYTRWI